MKNHKGHIVNEALKEIKYNIMCLSNNLNNVHMYTYIMSDYEKYIQYFSQTGARNKIDQFSVSDLFKSMSKLFHQKCQSKNIGLYFIDEIGPQD